MHTRRSPDRYCILPHPKAPVNNKTDIVFERQALHEFRLIYTISRLCTRKDHTQDVYVSSGNHIFSATLVISLFIPLTTFRDQLHLERFFPVLRLLVEHDRVARLSGQGPVQETVQSATHGSLVSDQHGFEHLLMTGTLRQLYLYRLFNPDT